MRADAQDLQVQVCHVPARKSSRAFLCNPDVALTPYATLAIVGAQICLAGWSVETGCRVEAYEVRIVK